MLIELSRQYAQLDLSITFAERTVDMIAEGIDLVVRIGDLKDDPELIARRLGDGDLLLRAVLDGCGLCQVPTWLVHVAALKPL